jgi:dTDP-4-amino-4,6-dideoxygalactose transaminase
MIPVMDLKRQYRQIKKELDAALKRVFERSNFVLGDEVRFLEQEFAAYTGAKYAAGVNSGTDALFLALKACGIAEGDEVITCAFGYIASVLGISYCGARPVLVDADLKDYNIDVNQIERAITKRTKAILPVHLYGQMCDMAPLMKIAAKYNLKMIEDCAQAHGAAYQFPESEGGWKKAGTIGDAGCYSFYPTKNIGAYGDGGMIVTDNEELYKQFLLLRDYGKKDRYIFAVKGYNSRLDELQAAMLRAKLPHLDQWNGLRKKIADSYRNCITSDQLVLPAENSGRNHVYHLFVARVKKREALQEYLLKKGTGTAVHYPVPIHLQEAYLDLGHKKGDFPIAEQLAREVLSLPMFPELKTSEVKTVCGQINSYNT